VLADTVRDLAPRLTEREDADPDRYPAESVADLIAAGVFRAPFPPALGGERCTLLDAVQAVEQIAAASPSLALLTAMPLGLAGVHALGPDVAPPAHRGGWADQIDRVAARYRDGAIYAACNSERGAGGSLAATRTIAERGADGRFRLTGEKILASFGRNAHVFFSTAKVRPEQLPGCGVVEFFLVPTGAPGVQVLDDWDGFGMRATESQTVRYADAPADEVMGFPNFIEIVQPVPYWSCLFTAIPLGCAAAVRRALSTPAPESPALRLRLADALMREEALRAYLHETARAWRPAAGPAYAARVLRTKAYVTQEATKLCAELYALGGGRHYTRTGRLARALAASFAGTALRPPLPLALDTLVQQFAGVEPEWSAAAARRAPAAERPS
jgi:alkylation response protein AidB-like acyl-CoA dehydrogenase